MIKEKTILNRILFKLEKIDGRVMGIESKVTNIEGKVTDIEVKLEKTEKKLERKIIVSNKGLEKRFGKKIIISNKGLEERLEKKIIISNKDLEERIDKRMEDRFEEFAIMVQRGFSETYDKIDRLSSKLFSFEKKEKDNSRRILFVENDHRSLETSHNRSLKRIARIKQRLEKKLV